MKAIIQPQYGGPEVLQLAEVAKPIPAENEVLIKVMASSVTTADSMMMTGKPYIGRLMLGLTKPTHQTPGTGFAGIVESVGEKVSNYQPGDQVFGESIKTFGTHAEYLCLEEDDLFVHMPKGIGFEEAAAVGDGVMTSLNFLHHVTTVEPWKKVLINGASGSLGSAAVQIAVEAGAYVTAVCGPDNVDFVRKLGAHEVINYSQEDFTKRQNEYDIIYDTVGKSNFQDAKESLKPDGVYASPVLNGGLLWDMLRTSLFGRKKARFSATGALPMKMKKQLQLKATEFLTKGIVRPFVSRTFRLEEFREAHTTIASGHKRGNIVFTPFQ